MPDLDDIDPASTFIGISLQGNSTPSNVSENQCDRFGKGFYFKDIPNNNPPAQVINFSCNQMKENMFGVEFDNSNIGDQGSPNPGGVSHGNYWIYTDNGVLDVFGNSVCKHLVASNYSLNNIPTWYHIDPVGGMGQVDFPAGGNTLPDYTNIVSNWIINDEDVSLTNGCEYVFVRENLTDNPNPEEKSGIKDLAHFVFPNPNDGNFIVKITSNYLGCELLLVNIFGQIVETSILSINTNEKRFSSFSLSDGLYQLQLLRNGELIGKTNIIINH
jgi:hypothetical protein